VAEFKRRLSPHPARTPRTAWQRLNRVKTDSGWPLLIVNALVSATFTAYFLASALSTHLISPFYWLMSVFSLPGLLRTGYVMTCVARGQRGQLAPEAPVASPDSGRYRGRYRGRHT
jgi:hypothetical protein